MSKTAKILIVCMAVLLAAAVVLGFMFMDTLKGLMKDPTAAFEQVEHHEIRDSAGVVLTTKPEAINILLLGIDSDDERESKNLGYRSDVMILCTIDPATNHVSMLSINRDTWAPIPLVDHDSLTFTGEYTKNKLNTAYSKGGYHRYMGVECSMKAISELLSCGGKLRVPIDYYCSIDMDGLTALCDAVGGVDVVLDQTMYYFASYGKPDYDRLLGREGETVHLEGESANVFVRARHSVDGGVEGRMKHQFQFMIALAEKIKSMGAVSAATSMYDEFLTYGRTNLSLDQVVAVAGVLMDMNVKDIEFYTIEGKYGYEGSSNVFYPDEDSIYENVTAMLYK